jgi:DNA-binding HxlR family transcriptional regulator
LSEIYEIKRGIQMKIRENYTCPLEIVHDLIKGKWKTILVFKLRNGTQTFSELKHGIDGISEKMLLQQIKELQEFGLVNKKCYEGYPLHVEYSLTDRGTQLLEAVLIMQKIGVAYMVEHGQIEVLEQQKIPYMDAVPTKK